MSVKCDLHTEYDHTCVTCRHVKVLKDNNRLRSNINQLRHTAKQNKQKIKKTLRQALDVLAREQYQDGPSPDRWPVCIGCKAPTASEGKNEHKNGCPIEALFEKAQGFGLNYERDSDA